MSSSILALDIGGANLKAAHGRGVWRLRPFALWKEPSALADALRDLLRDLPPFEVLAVTMTGELCDCFETKRQGVHAILDAVAEVAGRATVRVWRNDGRFVDVETARATALEVAAANWLALATFAGRYAPRGPGLLLDIGSTTSDLVPLLDGRPVPRGRTDPERLRCGELVYTGVRRTPLCALLGPVVAAELFATTLDVYLLLDWLAENPHDCHTADGRPATKAAAHDRLARMLCADRETSTEDARRQLAVRAIRRQAVILEEAIARVMHALPSAPGTFVLAGSGEFLAELVLEQQEPTPRVLSLSRELGLEASQAACAHALAVLAQEG